MAKAGLGGPLREAITPTLAPVGPAQMMHKFVPQGPPPNAPVQMAPPVKPETGGPLMPSVPGLPTGAGNLAAGPPKPSPDTFNPALVRRLQASGASPGMPPGRPVTGSAPPSNKPDVRAMLADMMATRNSRRVVGAIGRQNG